MRTRASVLLLCLAMAATTAACDTRPALSFAPDTLPSAIVGQAYTAVITISGNQTPVGDFYADPGLPPGITLEWDENGDRNSAQLIGNATAAGTYDFTISAWCLGTNVSGQTGSRQYRIVVFSPRLPAPT